MAVTSVTITQTNGTYLTVFNPLVFVADVVWTGTAPNDCDFEIEKDGSSIFIGRALAYSDSGNTRTFIAVVHEILQNEFTSYLDFVAQTNNSLLETNTNAPFTITFTCGGQTDSHDFDGFVASRQIGQAPTADIITGNLLPKFRTFKSMPFWLPLFMKFEECTITFENVTLTPAPTSLGKILRAQFVAPSSAGMYNATYDFETNTATVEVQDVCTDEIVFRFLDANGLYRLWKFNNRYAVEVKADPIGQLENFILSTNTTIGELKDIGYKAQSTYLLTTTVDIVDIDLFKDIYTSPVVYAYLNSAWVMVRLEFSSRPTKTRKGDAFTIDCTMTIPKTYTITR